MATIKAIEGRSVHQIQSGQVVVDLNSVVKELVENSLDAGATAIEVRFKNQGLDAIEVQDNGKGISPDDFETVALKHHTSKLSDYDDLNSLNTFGFRGEALSSLCALSRCYILTARAEDGALGKKLEFEHSGKLKGTCPVAAQKGTTVCVEEIFYNLPVRRKELEKNIKREYGKVISMLYQYACIGVGVRFVVSNHMPKGKRVPVFSTKINATTRENIANVFGAKTLLALSKLDLHLHMQQGVGPNNQGARNSSIQATSRSMEVQFQGHISKPVFGEGRQAPDRQMFFVNSRPCLLPQVSKAINEVYKSFNVSQSPFIFANLILDTNAYDVNVSPDKRSILLHDQTALLESMKSALTEMFEKTDHTVPQSSLLPNRRVSAYKPLTMQREESDGSFARSCGDGFINKPVSGREDYEQEATTGSSENLVHDWVCRDTVERPPSKRVALEKTPSAEPEPIAKATAISDLTATEVTDTTSLAEESSSQALASDQIAPSIDAVRNLNPLGTAYSDPISQQLPPRDTIQPSCEQEVPPIAVTAADAENFAEPSESEDKDDPERAAPELDQQTGSSIPVIHPGSQKSTPGPIQNAFDRMRPKRAPLQTAEITVGDKTTLTVIGSSPPHKKRRVHVPQDLQAVSRFGASPLLAADLRRSFAAPGSQMQQQSSSTLPSSQLDPVIKREDPDDGYDAEDERLARVPTRSPQAEAVAPAPPHPLSDAPDDHAPAASNDDDWDGEHIDEDEKKYREDLRIAAMISKAEGLATKDSGANQLRAVQALKNGYNRKDSPLKLRHYISTTAYEIRRQLAAHVSREMICGAEGVNGEKSSLVRDELDDPEAETRLSLTVTKADFAQMQITGQFNLGFILAVRPGSESNNADDLFIVDQHAADEKYNYERLQLTVTLQSQRLVRPKPLDLDAVQQEVVLEHSDALKANGFEIECSALADDECEESDQPRTFSLITLPMSKEKTFDLSDLEELLHLLSEQPPGSKEIPRPKKVQKMLAMRACRSSIMVGKTLTMKQMEKVVRHMGEMEKPWNCPHGRPTMRHLGTLDTFEGWHEQDPWEGHNDNDHGSVERPTDWTAFLERETA